MDVSDSLLVSNLDWDPSYLITLFSDDFDDNTDMWNSSLTDGQLLHYSQQLDREMYAPVCEDISLDDDTLRDAVENIEKE